MQEMSAQSWLKASRVRCPNLVPQASKLPLLQNHNHGEPTNTFASALPSLYLRLSIISDPYRSVSTSRDARLGAKISEDGDSGGRAFERLRGFRRRE